MVVGRGLIASAIYSLALSVSLCTNNGSNGHIVHLPTNNANLPTNNAVTMSNAHTSERTLLHK